METYCHLVNLDLSFFVVSSRGLERFLFFLPPLEYCWVLSQIEVGRQVDDGNLQLGFGPGFRGWCDGGDRRGVRNFGFLGDLCYSRQVSLIGQWMAIQED